MCDGSARGWLAGDWLAGDWPVTGGRGRSGRARALYGGWRCTENYCGGLDCGLRRGSVVVVSQTHY